jgi:hypothetical protein
MGLKRSWYFKFARIIKSIIKLAFKSIITPKMSQELSHLRSFFGLSIDYI